MAIQGLISPEVVKPKPVFDINEEAETTLEALMTLGVVGEDKEATHKSILNDYTALAETAGNLGMTGEAIPSIPYGMLATQQMVEVVDSHSFGKYPEPYVDDNLWIPGTEDGSYTHEQLAKSAGAKPTVRLALHTNESTQDPLLHFLDLPFDDYAKKEYTPDAETTQLEAIKSQKEKVETENPEVDVLPLSHRDFLMLALIRRIKGEQKQIPANMPISWGFMRDASLPRTEVDGRSVVGSVRSYRGRLYLALSGGRANFDDGVGIALELKES